MKKIYISPKVEIHSIGNKDNLCEGGLVGWSCINESDGSGAGGGNTEEGDAPEFGTAGAKKFDCWSTWDD